ncbi:motility repressor MogR, partial [Bacillus thuringiensis]
MIHNLCHSPSSFHNSHLTPMSFKKMNDMQLEVELKKIEKEFQ